MNGMFSGCLQLEEITGIEGLTTNLVSLLNSMFSKCSCITSLNLGNFDACSATNLDYMFQSCTNLVNLVSMKNIRDNISVEDCPSITVESILSIIDNLEDIQEIEEWLSTLPQEQQEPLPISRTLKLGAINLAKLTPEQIKIATDKGWSVA
jgi:surface protein